MNNVKNNNYEENLLIYFLIFLIENTKESFINFCNEVANKAKEKTNSTLALLYLSYDHKILEAVGRSGAPLENLEAAQIPFYRLDWDIPKGYEDIYDGFTSWAALNIKEVTYFYYEEDPKLSLKAHPSHKGQWDPIVWQGRPEQLYAIMFSPLIKVEQENIYHLFGLLKVELSYNDAEKNYKIGEPFSSDEIESFNHLVEFLIDILSFEDNNTWEKFKILLENCKNFDKLSEYIEKNNLCDKHSKDQLEEIAKKIPQLYKDLSDPQKFKQIKKKFWQLLAEYSESQKPQQLMAILKSWRSIEYNLSEGIGFILEFFRVRASRDFVIYILPFRDPWKSKSDNTQILYNTFYIMPYWRPSWRKSNPKPSFRLASDNNIIKSLNKFEDKEIVSFYQPKDGNAEIEKKLISASIKNKKEFNFNIKLILEKISKDIILKVKNIEMSENMGINFNNNLCEINIKKACMVDLTAGKSDFGKIIFPLEDNEIIDDNLYRDLVSDAVSFTRILSRTLGSMFKIRKNKFLPTLYPSGSQKLIVSFLDIRNFSTVTRILRLMGQDKLAAMELFMEHFCRIISLIANKWGRLDKFMGDGAMIIYGEDIISSDLNEEKIKQAILSSICSSISIFLAFKKLYEVWLSDELSFETLPWRFPESISKPLLKKIKYEHCEDINLDIGISLNYGIVYMDYFGDTYERQYTAIGDNVNLCARLCNEASRYDQELKRKRAPILITQPVYEYLKEFLTLNDQTRNPIRIKFRRSRNPLRIQFRGLGLDYPIWEIWPEDIDYGKVKRVLIDTPYKDLFYHTFEFINGNWNLTERFINELSLK